MFLFPQPFVHLKPRFAEVLVRDFLALQGGNRKHGERKVPYKAVISGP